MNKRKLESLPQTPGVYKFLDKSRNVLYVGKALNLRNRVKSYFNAELYDRPRIKLMIPKISDIQIIETNNDIESLVLESVLIKKLQPKFNSEKKDDKAYSWIYISTKDEFPVIKIVRSISEKELKNGKLFGPYPSTIATKRVFTYLRRIYPFCTCKKGEKKECFYFHLKLCPGPYQGHISKKNYRKNINEIIKFLSGRKRGQIVEMQNIMKKYSKSKQYEKAAQMRDKIRDLTYLGENTDFSIDDNEISYIERRKKVLKQNFIDLKMELGIKQLKRIECYDISNIQGKDAYGSMVVAEDGEIRRGEYRVFRIERMSKPDDPAMLKQVLQRRFDLKNKKKYATSPDLILIDGGKSQLSVVKNCIPNGITLLGISKGKRLKKRKMKLLDEYWITFKNRIEQIDIQNKSVLIDLRDEAHRFALMYHRKARIRKCKMSELDGIDGVGVKRRGILIKQFKTIEGIKKASLDELSMALKNKKVSEQIYRHFNHHLPHSFLEVSSES